MPELLYTSYYDNFIKLGLDFNFRVITLARGETVYGLGRRLHFKIHAVMLAKSNI